MAPPKDKERKRKFHRRSKNGCTRCKARHVRCDEQKPLCTNCLQTGSECIYPTPEQPLPSNDSSPSPSSSSSNVALGSFGSQMALTESAAPASPGMSNALNNYVGGSFDALPEHSKRLLRHFSQYTVWGSRPVARELESSACVNPNTKIVRESWLHAHVPHAISMSVGMGYRFDGRGQDPIPVP
ncbi:hypothetical protein HZS61_010135 [Fusarium oxysporum f. sp. conglutinans]|uniref:Zn(2)-C6 fungal-type domain-containing protein n=1 Tax=Fusarium oxysporum f. sp. conglutinans TaxID=100902 RepID=A0A8H6H0K1_FUSOX|nr:hypothetical protein HZS61_010135 [Fusarium oxysporum f. sp. conglutinans]